MLSHDCQIRVWYKHTDQMAICHHSNYICYYEAARSEFLRALGMSFAEVERRGIMMPILEVQSKYRKPAYFDELLTVRIILREMPSTRINFFYEIYNERGDLLNTGMTQLGFIHSDSEGEDRFPVRAGVAGVDAVVAGVFLQIGLGTPAVRLEAELLPPHFVAPLPPQLQEQFAAIHLAGEKVVLFRRDACFFADEAHQSRADEDARFAGVTSQLRFELFPEGFRRKPACRIVLH